MDISHGGHGHPSLSSYRIWAYTQIHLNHQYPYPLPRPIHGLTCCLNVCIHPLHQATVLSAISIPHRYLLCPKPSIITSSHNVPGLSVSFLSTPKVPIVLKYHLNNKYICITGVCQPQIRINPYMLLPESVGLRTKHIHIGVYRPSNHTSYRSPGAGIPNWVAWLSLMWDNISQWYESRSLSTANPSSWLSTVNNMYPYILLFFIRLININPLYNSSINIYS